MTLGESERGRVRQKTACIPFPCVYFEHVPLVLVDIPWGGGPRSEVQRYQATKYIRSSGVMATFVSTSNFPLDLIGVVVVVGEQGGFPLPGAHPSNPSNPPPTHPRPSPPWCASSLLCLIQQFCPCLLLTTTMHDMLPVCYGLPFRFTSSLLRLAEASRFQISCVLFTSRLQVY